MSNAPFCPTCGASMKDRDSYCCATCGAHNDAMYRREHQDPAYAKTLTRAQIAQEYRDANRPVPEELL